MVNIELYRIFIAIYRAGTISKAAELCKITQPAASQQLASLEKILKVKLFRRTPREMVATNEGHELYTRVADSFDWLDFVSQDFMMRVGGEKVLLSVGMPREFYKKKLVLNIGNLPFRVDISFGNHKLLVEELKSGKIDILISDEKIVNTYFYSEEILTQKYCLVGNREVMPPEDGFDQWQYVRAWVREHTWISYDVDLSVIRLCFKEQYDLQPNIDPKLILPDLEAMVMTLQTIPSVCILPEYFCKSYIDEKAINLLHSFEVRGQNKLYFSYARSSKNNILIKKFKVIL